MLVHRPGDTRGAAKRPQILNTADRIPDDGMTRTVDSTRIANDLAELIRRGRLTVFATELEFAHTQRFRPRKCAWQPEHHRGGLPDEDAAIRDPVRRGYLRIGSEIAHAVRCVPQKGMLPEIERLQLTDDLS
jgi:hypothetical protein